MASDSNAQNQLEPEMQCPSSTTSSEYEILIKGLNKISHELRSMETTTNALIKELNDDLENIEKIDRNF